VKQPVAVLISGNGSNLQALMDACEDPDYPARIVVVISNREKAFGVTRAQRAGIPVEVIHHEDFPDRESFDHAMQEVLVKRGAKVVCLAGFMRILSPWFVRRWEGRMLNVHPSLLPQFKGAHAVRDALAAGATETGCTVHLVSEEVDGGAVVMQSPLVKILEGDTEATLQDRIHMEEHLLYPQALRRLVIELNKA
jgi:phosphoribosylglycinamide formyltransferase 1